MEPLTELATPSLNMLTFEQIKTAYTSSEPPLVPDPALAHVELPLRKIFYPFGFPIEVSTNSEEVLSISQECWNGFPSLFEITPIRLHVGVTAGGAAHCPPTPKTRLRENICSHIADAENFCVSDASTSFSFMWIAAATLAHRNYIRYFFLESCAMFHLAARYTMPIHAGCVELDGVGILLCGDSGAGKSTLSYACARAGWTYISDDASFLVIGRKDNLVVGNGGMARFRPSAKDLFPELQGRPVRRRAEIGKPSIELETTSRSLHTAFSSHVRRLVFLNRNGLSPKLVPLPAAIARTFILQNRLGNVEVAEQQTAVLNDLLDRGVFELHYSDLDSAINLLAGLIKEDR